MEASSEDTEAALLLSSQVSSEQAMLRAHPYLGPIRRGEYAKEQGLENGGTCQMRLDGAVVAYVAYTVEAIGMFTDQ